jgi:hypothetical protein
MGYKKIKKELYNVAVPLSCISIRCWFAAADRSRCLALLYKLLWPRSHAEASRCAARPP